jgi:putative phosphotransacetylase
LIFENVKIRANDRFDLDFHIDIEEANAAGIRFGDWGEIISSNKQQLTNNKL